MSTFYIIVTTNFCYLVNTTMWINLLVFKIQLFIKIKRCMKKIENNLYTQTFFLILRLFLHFCYNFSYLIYELIS
jgi:hypothetical protein